MARAAMMKRLVLAFLLGVSLIFSGCGGGGSSDEVIAADPETDPVQKYPGPTMAETIDTLQNAKIKVIGIAVARDIPQLAEIVDATSGAYKQIPAYWTQPYGDDLVVFLREALAGFVNDSANGAATDVLFLVDISGSVDKRIIQDNASIMLNDIFPLNSDVAVGVATFCDFPIEPWGSPGDEPFSVLQSITEDRTLVEAGFAALDTPTQGGDSEESQLEALYQAALGTGNVGWRPDATRVIVLLTDSSFHEPSEE